MSEVAARAFHARLKSDPTFAAAIADAASPSDARAIMTAAGIDEFSPAELEAVAHELSDADLQRVAGGSGGQFALERAATGRAFEGVQNLQVRAWMP